MTRRSSTRKRYASRPGKFTGKTCYHWARSTYSLAHIFKDWDFNKINFEFPVVGGPYTVEALREGIALTLKRRADWWQRDRESVRGTANFDRLKFRFFTERENAFAEFKTGNLDYYPVSTASRWATETSGEAYDNNWIIKQEVYKL